MDRIIRDTQLMSSPDTPLTEQDKELLRSEGYTKALGEAIEDRVEELGALKGGPGSGPRPGQRNRAGTGTVEGGQQKWAGGRGDTVSSGMTTLRAGEKYGLVHAIVHKPEGISKKNWESFQEQIGLPDPLHDRILVKFTFDQFQSSDSIRQLFKEHKVDFPDKMPKSNSPRELKPKKSIEDVFDEKLASIKSRK